LHRITKYRKIIGAWGEAFAAQYLRRQGYEIWERNWFCRAGEIDLVAFVSHVLVIVEVKSRVYWGTSAFSPFDAIGKEKLQHLEATAAAFITERARQLKIRHLTKFRVDAVGISLHLPRLRLKLEHLIGTEQQIGLSPERAKARDPVEGGGLKSAVQKAQN
jgi:putative endonuclease